MNLAKLYAGYRARLNSYRARANELRENQSQLKDWDRLCYIARQTNQNRNITATGHNNFFMRTEPTWGDLGVFIRIISGVSPHNSSQLITAYGSFSNIKHLQLVRNACAHKNIETIRELNSYNYLYNFGRLDKATDFVWSINNQSNTIAIELWMYEMSKISDLATQ